MTFAKGDFGLCQYEGNGVVIGGATGMRARSSMIAFD
jgi:hypothetical protein